MPLVGEFAPLLVTKRKHGSFVVMFRAAEIRIRLLHLNAGDFNLREAFCIHQHSALCQREGRARGQTFGAKASAPKKHETRQTHTRCCTLMPATKTRSARAAGKAKSQEGCAARRTLSTAADSNRGQAGLASFKPNIIATAWHEAFCIGNRCCKLRHRPQD